jgi:mono/diheme cytochrome c family protein
MTPDSQRCTIGCMRAMLRVVWLACLGPALLGMSSCGHRAAAGPAADPAAKPATAAVARAPASPEAGELRERMRSVITPTCGSCHRATLPTAKPAAIAIYNLDAPDWSATLTAAQLEGGFARRLERALDDEGRALMRRFVVQEVALRR